MSRGWEVKARGLLFNTACSASQARALIGANTSKLASRPELAEPWRVGTALALRQCGQSAASWNLTASVVLIRRAAVNGSKSWIVSWRTGRAAQGREPGTTLWRGLLAS